MSGLQLWREFDELFKSAKGYSSKSDPNGKELYQAWKAQGGGRPRTRQDMVGFLNRGVVASAPVIPRAPRRAPIRRKPYSTDITMNRLRGSFPEVGDDPSGLARKYFDEYYSQPGRIRAWRRDIASYTSPKNIINPSDPRSVKLYFRKDGPKLYDFPNIDTPPALMDYPAMYSGRTPSLRARKLTKLQAFNRTMGKNISKMRVQEMISFLQSHGVSIPVPRPNIKTLRAMVRDIAKQL